MEEKEKIVVPAEMCDRAETEKEIVLKKKSLWKQLVMGVVYALVLVFIIIQLLLLLEERHRPALSYKCPHEWRDNPYSPRQCSRCGSYASGSLYICVICGKTKSTVSLPCGGCDDSDKMIRFPDVEETLEWK